MYYIFLWVVKQKPQPNQVIVNLVDLFNTFFPVVRQLGFITH